jgi:hypothetical protein
MKIKLKIQERINQNMLKKATGGNFKNILK